jgi:hypothetical protein
MIFTRDPGTWPIWMIVVAALAFTAALGLWCSWAAGAWKP